MTAVAVITWAKDWSAAPLVQPSSCRHPGSAALALGLRVEHGRGGRSTVITAATFCMLCGTDSSGKLPREEALQAAWKEFGWHRSTGERLLALADRSGLEPHVEPSDAR